MKAYLSVASFTDAWIETRYVNHLGNKESVASFTDAWIETVKTGVMRPKSVSHLLQMRGLKLELLYPV